MTAHFSPGLIGRYLARSLPPAEVLALHAHLESCAECRGKLEKAALEKAWENVEPNPSLHLSEAEMVAYVAGRRPEAAHHVADCELCRDSVQAMQEAAAEESVRGLPSRGARVRWFVAGGAIAASLAIALIVHAPPAHPPMAGRTVPLNLDGVSDGGLEGATPAELGLVRDALRKRSLPPGPAQFTAEKPGMLLAAGGASASFSLTGPLDTRVLSDRPVFSWQADPGATAYQVVVTNESLDPLARSGRISATQWQPEAALPRGAVLMWQVRAWRGGEMTSAPAPPAPPARFEIAGAEVAGRIEMLRALPRPSHLLLAVICAREGLRDDAAKELQELARANPDSPLVRSLSGSL
jgi:hypothetical protein